MGQTFPFLRSIRTSRALPISSPITALSPDVCLEWGGDPGQKPVLSLCTSSLSVSQEMGILIPEVRNQAPFVGLFLA